jgi:hypothetical protein
MPSPPPIEPGLDASAGGEDKRVHGNLLPNRPPSAIPGGRGRPRTLPMPLELHPAASELVAIVAAEMAWRDVADKTPTSRGSSMTLPEPPRLFESELAIRLQEYAELQRRVKRHGHLVHLLTRQVARYGFVDAPAVLQLELEEERDKLARLQVEIAELEQNLTREVRAYATAEAQKASETELHIRQQRIERLSVELKYKYELAAIYQQNIRRLEQKQAEYGMVTPLSILNEVDETMKELRILLAQIEAISQTLEDEYSISPEELQGIELLSDTEIESFVQKIAELG